MPRDIDISIHCLAHTIIDALEVRKWLDKLGVNEFDLPPRGEVSSPALLIALAAKRCYLAFEPGLNPNVTKVRSDYTEYFDNILRQGHGSVLEHATYSYAIEGLSRVATAELNRHRAGWAISEGSLRFIRFDEIPFWMPDSFRDAQGDDLDLQVRKTKSRQLFRDAFAQMERTYAEFCDIWQMDEGDKNFAYKKRVTSAARRIVGMGVSTGGVWTGNIRALRHVIAMRTDPAAEEEIAHVFTMIAQDIIKREPMLFQDFKPMAGGYQPQHWKV